MSDLLVLGFDGADTADRMLSKLRSLKPQESIDLHDDRVLVHPEDADIQIKQSVNLAAIGASSGMSTGVLPGVLAGPPATRNP